MKFLSAVGIAISIICVGCSSQSPYLASSYSVEREFDFNQYPKNLIYYACGTLKEPLALVALDPKMKFESPDWQRVNTSDDSLSKWVRALHLQPRVEYNSYPNGAYISDTHGNRIGMLYCVWRFPNVYYPAPGQIDISKPKPELRVTNRDLFL